MRVLELEVGAAPHTIFGHVVWCGDDVIAIIGGGTRSHVGAAALAEVRRSFSGDGSISSSASVLSRLEHKDDLAARSAALYLSKYLQKTVVATVGLHVDQATAEDITILQSNLQLLLDKIVMQAQ